MWLPVALGCCLTYIVVSIIAHRYFRRRQRSSGWKILRDVRRLLLVIAHPDDECLFFGPILQGVLSYSSCFTSDHSRDSDVDGKRAEDELDRPDVHVLCLSSGNYRNRGNERKLELLQSCRRLGVMDSHITVIEHSKLRDDPRCHWNKHLVKEIVLRHVEQLAIDTVISFDRYGVSGHSNHGAICVALQQLYSRGMLPVDTRVFVLESVSILRKYMGLLDIPWSCWRSNYCYINGWREFTTVVGAMMEHRTQLTWYRMLYLMFSRYMIVNTLRRISPS